VSDLFDAESIARLEDSIDGWLAELAATNPTIEAIDRGEGDGLRWYVRMRGEEKEFITIWLTLGQRTLRYEAYVMPAPEENLESLYENMLRRNQRLIGHHFAIGVEDAVFLRGDLPVTALTQAELDRVLGSMYATTEQCFQGFLRIGFASRFA
jgi:hypothetical protein